MQNPVKNKATSLRKFRVGIVGGSADTLSAFGRIFSVTAFRARAYEAVPVRLDERNLPDDLDLVILCTLNPHVLALWDDGKIQGSAAKRPQIRLVRRGQSEDQDYVLESPINPSRLLKTLDNYTIKELNYLPEFEIGHDSTRLTADTLAGLRLLNHGQGAAAQRREGLARALVVDDSLPVRKQIEIEFGLFGVEVVQASSAEAALGAALNTRFDIIFMDVIMPGLDGYAACRRIKKTHANKNTPIILLTSRSSRFDKVLGSLAGCSAYLVKPINHNDFEEIIRKYFPAKKG